MRCTRRTESPTSTCRAPPPASGRRCRVVPSRRSDRPDDMSHLKVTGEAAGEVRQLVPDVETLARRLAAIDYLVDEGLATSMFLSLRLPQPLLLEGEAGSRQDRGRQVAGSGARHAADPLAVLRRNRRRRGTVRVELSAPAAQHPPRRGERRRSSGRRTCSAPTTSIRRPLLRALEHPGPAAGGAADRRDRPGRRRLRGVPARAARRGDASRSRRSARSGRRIRR